MCSKFNISINLISIEYKFELPLTNLKLTFTYLVLKICHILILKEVEIKTIEVNLNTLLQTQISYQRVLIVSLDQLVRWKYIISKFLSYTYVKLKPKIITPLLNP